MRSLLVLLSACAVACSLNPQPLPPDRDNTGAAPDASAMFGDDGAAVPQPDGGMVAEAGADARSDAMADAAADAPMDAIDMDAMAEAGTD